jgi:hypothetical protein
MTASFDASQATGAAHEAGERLSAVRARIDAAARQSARASNEIQLLAVSKLQPLAKLQSLFGAGQRAFGENYVQEALDKIALFRASAQYDDIVWHLIGPLQSNKTRVVAEYFHWVHSVDRLKIAERLSIQRPAHLPPLNVCIQVNISGEASKGGCEVDQAVPLVEAAGRLPGVCVRGLMGMPEPGIDEAATRAQFMILADLFSEVRRQGLANARFDTLSMGMSDDLEIAIACGSTMVRVGTALFGARPVL